MKLKPIKLTTLSLLAMMLVTPTALAKSKHHTNINHNKVVNVYNVKQLRKALKKTSHKHLTINLEHNLSQTNHIHKYEKGTGYKLNSYLEQYNPKVYGRKATKGLMEDARKRAENKQKKDVEVKVPSHVTINGNQHSVKGLNFITNGNHIHFNALRLQAPIDDFPQWDAKDGKSGNWNSQYDAISLKHTKHSSVTNSYLTDGKHLDKQPSKKTFNRQYQQHDGLTDITNGSNHILLNNNTYANHDKAILIGNSDNRTSDKGKLRTTITHNKFINVSQRMPRVRFGKVRVSYNQYYSNNTNPYKLVAILENGKDGIMYGSHDTFNIKHVNKKDLAKKVAQNKGGKYLHFTNVNINDKNFNLKLKHNDKNDTELMQKKIKKHHLTKHNHKQSKIKRSQRNDNK